MHNFLINGNKSKSKRSNELFSNESNFDSIVDKEMINY